MRGATIEPLRLENISDLSSILGGPALHRVSVYVAFERASTGLHASELRLRAAVELAEARLRERGVAASQVTARLELLAAVEPELRSLDGATRTLVWLGDARGWAFAPLPERVDDRVVVAQHYALRPLLRALQRTHRFRILAVSTNRVAAYEGDVRGLRPLALDGVPASLEEALGTELERGRHSFPNEQPAPARGSGVPVYHGAGGADDERAVDRERYHRILGSAISSAWRGSDLPIVLAAEVRTAGELRKHVHLPSLLDEELRGCPDQARTEEIHARAWPIVQSALNERETQLAEGFEEARNAGKSLEGDFDATVAAAIAGRIRRLWVEEEARLPGLVDEMRARRCEANDPCEDALDALVALVLRRGGDVRVAEPGQTPTGAPFCAQLR